MKITVTGCNNCPFSIIQKMSHKYCALDNHLKSKLIVDVTDPAGRLRTDTPIDCPITLNGGTITVTTKSE